MDISNSPSPAPAPGQWSRRRRLILGLTALAVIGGGGAAIAAGNPDTDRIEPADAPATASPTVGRAAFALGGVLHSESVVADGNGGYLTQLTQFGTIESIDPDRLTVVSEDGYERSWTRTSDTAVDGGGWSVSKNDDGSYTVQRESGELAAGDQVLVVGTVEDEVATATRIASRPDTGEIPGGILKRFEGEFGGKGEMPMHEMPMHGDRLMKRFDGRGDIVVPGPMGGPSGDVRRFEFRSPDAPSGAPDGEAPETVPAPAASLS